ncbi:MAG: hypothetical protein KDA85_10700, partial [Planctomycetaceae bacterium]|nr:hypothetical protein [Planctomycetaceae bacterium]
MKTGHIKTLDLQLWNRPLTGLLILLISLIGSVTCAATFAQVQPDNVTSAPASDGGSSDAAASVAADSTAATLGPSPADNPASSSAVEETSAATANRPETTSVSKESSSTNVQSFQATELDLPESTPGILAMLAAVLLVGGLVIRTSLRDSRFLRRPAQFLLLFPRLLVLLIALAIALNPQQRTQISRIEKSRVDLLLDTSLSMAYPVSDTASEQGDAVSPINGTESRSPNDSSANASTSIATPTNTDHSQPVSRAEAIADMLLQQGVLKELSKTHSVALYTFDGTLVGPAATISDGEIRFVKSTGHEARTALDDDGDA